MGVDGVGAWLGLMLGWVGARVWQWLSAGSWHHHRGDFYDANIRDPPPRGRDSGGDTGACSQGIGDSGRRFRDTWQEQETGNALSRGSPGPSLRSAGERSGCSFDGRVRATPKAHSDKGQTGELKFLASVLRKGQG